MDGSNVCQPPGTTAVDGGCDEGEDARPHVGLYVAGGVDDFWESNAATQAAAGNCPCMPVAGGAPNVGGGGRSAASVASSLLEKKDRAELKTAAAAAWTEWRWSMPGAGKTAEKTWWASPD